MHNKQVQQKAKKQQKINMVEVNTRGNGGGCNFGTCVGYFLYFSILAAVAVVGEFWQLNKMSYV